MYQLCTFLVSDEEYAGQPLMEIEGAPAIKQYSILSDKRHILTKDTKGHVQLYDALMVSYESLYTNYVTSLLKTASYHMLN